MIDTCRLVFKTNIMISKLTVFVTLLALLSCSQGNNNRQRDTPKLNIELMSMLDSMGRLDQQYRSVMSSVAEQYGWSSPKMDSLWSLQNTIDESNILKLEQIISSFGFPGRSLVGDSGSRYAFLILQHSNDAIMEKYYDEVLCAGKEGELAMNRVAMYQDRVLMRRGEKQIYGTQIRSERLVDPHTGENYDSAYVWPIIDPDNVNNRRFKVGLNEPIEEYAAKFGVIY